MYLLPGTWYHDSELNRFRKLSVLALGTIAQFVSAQPQMALAENYHCCRLSPFIKHIIRFVRRVYDP